MFPLTCVCVCSNSSSSPITLLQMYTHLQLVSGDFCPGTFGHKLEVDCLKVLWIAGHLECVTFRRQAQHLQVCHSGALLCAGPMTSCHQTFTVYFNSKNPSALKLNFSALCPRFPLPGDWMSDIPRIKENARHSALALLRAQFAILQMIQCNLMDREWRSRSNRLT